MKGIKALFCLIVMLGMAAIVSADSYTVTIPSHTVTGTVGDFTLGAFPQITGGAYVQEIIIANAGATAQDVEIYTTATSTTTATLVTTISLPAAIGTYSYSMPTGTPLKLRNVAIRKSSASSVVKGTLIYR
jgi:hypothetical protein